MSDTDHEQPDDSSKEPLLPYYVYVLLNPMKGNRPFYVGKGTGQRAGAHNRDVDRLLREQKLEGQHPPAEDGNDEAPLDAKSRSEKEQEIMALKNHEKSPLEVIVGRYETEEEAFAVEATLMHFMFGHENLTNIASGHGSKFIRTKADYDDIVANAKSQEDIPKKAGIDEERKKNLRDGARANEKIQALTQAGAYDVLDKLQKSLTDRNFNWRNFSEPGDKRFHPSVSNGYLAVIVRIGPLDLNVQFTQSLVFSVQFIYTRSPEDPEVKAALQLLESRLKITLGKPKVTNKYSWFEPNDSYREITEMDDLLSRLEQLRSVLEPTNQAGP